MNKKKAILSALLIIITTSFAKDKLIQNDLNSKNSFVYEDTTKNLDYRINNNKIYKFYGNEILKEIITSNYNYEDKLIGRDNKEKIENYLRKEGYNDAVICGLMACMYQASHYNPETIGDGGWALGIIQWNKERMDRLIKYCDENGYKPESLEGQLEYFVYQLKTGDNGNNKYYTQLEEFLRSVSNDENGAYQSAYRTTCYVLRPENMYDKADGRGYLAMKMFREMNKNKIR